MKKMVVVLHKNTIAYRVILILKAYQKRGYDININMFVTNPECKVNSLYDFRINNIHFPSAFKKMRRLRWVSLLMILFFKLKNQLVAADALYIDTFFLLPFGYLVKKFYGLNIIYDQREMFIFSYKKQIGKFFGLFEKIFIFCADDIYTVDSHQSFWKKRYKDFGKDVTVVMNVPSINGLRVACDSKKIGGNESRHEIDLVFVGDINQGSNIIRLLQVLKKLPNNFYLNLVGYQDEKYCCEIKRQADENNLAKRIRFYDWMPYEKLVKTISRFHVGLMTKGPSFKQHGYIGKGNSRKVFTYMHAGLPIVGPDYNSMALQIEEENCGVRVDIENWRAIYEGIMKIVEDPKIYEQMVENASNAIGEKYNWELEEKKIYDVIDRRIGHSINSYPK